MHRETQAFQQPFTKYAGIIQGLAINADQVKGDEDTRKEVDVPEAVQQGTKRPKGRRPKPSKTSPAHTSLLTRQINMQDDTGVSNSLVEAIAKCLLKDSEIRFSLSVAMTKMANERLKRNLATLLKNFAFGISDFSLHSLAHFVSVTAPKDRKYY